MPDGLEIALHHKFTEQQKAFASALVSGLSPVDSARAAGYTETTAPSAASTLMQQPAILAMVQIYAARELSLGAPGAIKLLRRFVDDADGTWDPKIRLAAANSILNRAGHIAPKAAEQGKAGETPLNEMTMGELRDLADKLEGEIAGRAKEVSSTKPAPHVTQAIDDII